jgi:sugar O-acyltransferase (sialic acid O-acetyltransferase NeuD family)
LKSQIYIIGSGGHARVVARAVQENRQKSIFIVSRREHAAAGLDWIAESDFIANPPFGDQWGIICGVGSIGSMLERDRVLKRYESLSERFVSVISQRAVVDSSAILNPGVFVGPGAVIANDVSVGRHCLINTGAIVEHDCFIDINCHIASGAIVLGGVRLGRDVFVGAGSVVMQGASVADNVTIGASSFCNQNIGNSNTTWVGLPARRLTK